MDCIYLSQVVATKENIHWQLPCYIKMKKPAGAGSDLNCYFPEHCWAVGKLSVSVVIDQDHGIFFSYPKAVCFYKVEKCLYV